MSLDCGWGAGNSAFTISLDPLTIERSLSFISYFLTLWKHCYSITRVSWDVILTLIPWFIFCCCLICRQLWTVSIAPTPTESHCAVFYNNNGYKYMKSLLSTHRWGGKWRQKGPNFSWSPTYLSDQAEGFFKVLSDSALQWTLDPWWLRREWQIREGAKIGALSLKHYGFKSLLQGYFVVAASPW